MEDTKVHAVVRDDARNMAKAMKDSKLTSFGCMAHSLQLGIHDGVLTQPSVGDILKNSRPLQAFAACLLTPSGCTDEGQKITARCPH